MNWDAVGAIGEVLGALVVLATILYLAIQTRTSVRLAKSQGPQWISDGINTWLGSLRNDPEMTRLVRISLHRWSELSFNEQTRVHSFFCEMMVHLDAIVELSNQDLVATPLARAWIENAAGVVSTKGGAEWWFDAKFFFSPMLRETIDSRIMDQTNPPVPWTRAPFYMLEDEDLQPSAKQ